jgi:fumarate hydratase class II
MTRFRTESDSMGELQVPEDASYGAQTQRAILNFPVSGLCMPRAFLNALGLVKQACARANRDLGALDADICEAITTVCDDVINGVLDDQFPVDIFQTGSGTSTNMNANEVIAHLASASSGSNVHPNDHVNMSQSSNDVIPSCIHVSAAITCTYDLIPAL